MSNLVKEFNDYRTRMNDVILSKDNLVIKRLRNLDTNTYAQGTPWILKRRNYLAWLPAWRSDVMIVLNTIWAKPMNWVLLLTSYTKYLLLPI
jgi:hypothetical protein